MATNTLSAVPHDNEPLPRYTRDPETSSIHSTAPSYVSEAPSYHSTQHDSIGSTNPSSAHYSTQHTSPAPNANTTPSQNGHTHNPTSGTRIPTPQTQRQRAHPQSISTDIHSLAARMMRPAPAQRYTFPDSAGFVNETKARKMYIRELREEAALREKGMMWGYVTGQIRGQREREKVWEGKTGGKGWGLGMKI